MYRNVGNEKVELACAKSPGIATRKIGFGAVATFAAVVLKAVRRDLARVATERELSRLDDRSLADIGLSQGTIGTVAARAAGNTAEPDLGTAFAIMLRDAILAPLMLWRARSQAAQELYRLGDRELLDIGLTRSDIPAVVATMGARPAPTSAPTSDGVFGIAAWNRARVTAKELSRLDDHPMNDVGVVRGDIEWLASRMASKGTQIGNRNQPKYSRPSAA